MIIVNNRFIRIVDHLEKEVRIYDTINEKKIFNIFFNELDSAIGLNGALTDTVDLLNDLSEENDVLKQQLSEQGTQIDFLKDENTHMRNVLNENKQLKQRNNRQAKQLDRLYNLIEEKDWRTLSDILDDFKRCEEQLQKEWGTYGDVE